jgi:hypothetical protein
MHAVPVVHVQVEQAKGVVSGQLLLQLETDLLLTLVVRQLTASILDSHPGAQAAREVAYHLNAAPFARMWRATSLHKLPQLATYTGPQVALQLLPSPLLPLSPPPRPLPPQQQHQQRRRVRRAVRRQAQQPEQPVDWWVLAPTAPLLTELLPLLKQQSYTQLQRHLEQQQQQPEACPVQQPPSPLELLDANLQCMTALLLGCVVPAPCATAAAAVGPPPAAATAAEAMTSLGRTSSQAPYACVLHAQDALMPLADILGMIEAALRCEATRCREAAIAATAAASSSGSSDGAATAATATALDARGALHTHAGVWMELCFPKAHGDHPPYPSPMVLLALAAGPGSQVQRQLQSLLATMVKLSRWIVLDDADRRKYHAAASCIAWALLDATNKKQQQRQQQQPQQQQQQQQQEAVGAAAGVGFSCSRSSADAVATLPTVVILGRCCMMWAEHNGATLSRLQQQQEEDCCSSQGQQQEPSSCQVQQQEQHEGPSINQKEEQQQQEEDSSSCCEEEEEEGSNEPGFRLDHAALLSVIHQWMAAGSTCDQLAAAGYAPLPLQQQLLATKNSLQSGPNSETWRTVTAQRLLSTGLALCSFAVPCMCNNPGCTSMAGVSELAAVSGRSCICAGCRVARYCGGACQRAAWKQHKPVCAALSAAAAAAAVSTG